MNTLFLVVIAIFAFTFGYRFFAKLLTLGIFRLDSNYSTPAQSQTDDRDYVPANRHYLFGYHAAAVASATTLTGGGMALFWGWIPAFLWLVVGTTVAAATYGVGSLWLALRHPGMGLGEMAGSLLRPYNRYLLGGLAFALLLVLNAIFAAMAARLFSRYPTAVAPFWLLVLGAVALGSYLHGRSAFTLVPASVVALLLSLLAIWMLDESPLAISGALNLDARGATISSLDATALWVVLILIYGYFAAYRPVWRLVRPHGYLTALLLGLVLIFFYAGILVAHPPLTAPEFNTVAEGPGVLPWLLITLTSGAFAGYHLLISHGITAKQLRRETDARYLGYGGALVDGLIALSALLIAGTAFGAGEAWQTHYRSWDGLHDLTSWLILYIDGCVRYAAELGLDELFVRTLVAVTVISLTVTTLGAGLRIQKQLLAEFLSWMPPAPVGEATSAPAIPARWWIRFTVRIREEKSLAWLAVGVTAVLALSDGLGLGGLKLWPVFGITSLVLGVFGLLLLTLALRRSQQPYRAVAALMAVLWTTTIWALGTQLAHWWETGEWLLWALGLGLLGIAVVLVVEAFHALKNSFASAAELDS